MAADVRVRLDAYAHGECDYEALVAAIRIFCKTNADAVWEVLSVLDQYHRRGTLPDDAFRSLKATASYIALGPPVAAARRAVRVESNATPHSNQTVPHVEGPITETRDEPAASEAAQDNAATHALNVEPVPAEITAAQFLASATGSDHTAFHELPRDALVSKQEQRERSARQAAVAKSVIPGRVLHDRYEIESALAFGRSTAVFRGRDRFRTHNAERSLALKVLLIPSLPNAAAQFEHELQIAQQLSHPNVVKVFELDRDGELLFYSMELIAGQTLSDLLQFAPPRRPQAMAILTQVANALTYLHERDIAHGDVHPDNILISSTGQVKLLDFGAAVECSTSPPWPVADAGDAPSSSLLYASCERLEGQRADKRDDIFSLSCIAYELMGREHPFRGKLATAARAAQLTPPRLQELSPRQWRSLQQGLSWQREARPAAVREWLAGFEATATASETSFAAAMPGGPAAGAKPAAAGMHQPISAGPRIGVPPAPPRTSSRRVSSTWYIAIVVGVLAVLAFVFMRFDFDAVTAPGLAQAQRSVKQAINQGVGSLADSSANTPRTPSDATNAQLQQPAAPPPLESPANLSTVAPTTNEHAPTNDVAAAQSSSVASVESATASVADVGGNGAAQVVVPPSAATVSNGRAGPARDNKPTLIAESHGRIGFVQDTFMVSKYDGAARIKLKRDGGAAGKVTFTWWAEPGTAESGKDFMSLGKKTETLDNGEREITVFVPLIAGSDNNNRHVFFVELSDPSNGLGVGKITRARVIIADESR